MCNILSWHFGQHPTYYCNTNVCDLPSVVGPSPSNVGMSSKRRKGRLKEMLCTCSHNTHTPTRYTYMHTHTLHTHATHPHTTHTCTHTLHIHAHTLHIHAHTHYTYMHTHTHTTHTHTTHTHLLKYSFPLVAQSSYLVVDAQTWTYHNHLVWDKILQHESLL